MLNKNGERELCYVVKVDDIQPIQGRDKVEAEEKYYKEYSYKNSMEI